VKLALKYKPRPKIAEGFIPRTLDARVDARLSALLEAREAEGSLARALFTPDAPASGPADTDSHAGEQPEPVSLKVTVSPAPVKAPPTTKMPAEPSVRQRSPVLRVTTVPLIKPKAAAAALLPQQHPLPVPLLQLQAGQNRNWRSSPQNRDRTCCRPA
jgi:hypothetical protein